MVGEKRANTIAHASNGGVSSLVEGRNCLVVSCDLPKMLGYYF